MSEVVSFLFVAATFMCAACSLVCFAIHTFKETTNARH